MAVEAQEEAGILFVAAAGNNGNDNDLTPHYPAGFVFDHIISVAATTGGDNLADFSNFGGSTVDMAAPGSQVHSTILGAQYGYINGTSMAAPQVTGAVALLKAADPTLEWDDLKQLILSNVDQLMGLSGKAVTRWTFEPASRHGSRGRAISACIENRLTPLSCGSNGRGRLELARGDRDHR